MFKQVLSVQQITKVVYQTCHKKRRRAKPRNGFYTKATRCKYALTAVVDQTHYDKGRRAKPATGFILFVVALKANCCSLVGDLQSYGSIDFLLTT